MSKKGKRRRERQASGQDEIPVRPGFVSLRGPDAEREVDRLMSELRRRLGPEQAAEVEREAMAQVAEIRARHAKQKEQE